MNNKEVVRKLNEGFNNDDVEAIVSCVADDVRWDVPGAFVAVGKDEFRKQIHHEDFVGLPKITVTNEVAKGDYVTVEGSVETTYKSGQVVHIRFCDTFRFENGKIKEMTSYLVPMKS